MGTGPKTKLDLNVFYADLKRFADISEVPMDSEMVLKTLNLFEDIYSQATISVRTTTKPVGKRDVNMRYMEPHKDHDPFQRLVDAGLIVLEGHPVEKLVPVVMERYPIWWGMDVALSHGVEKLWPFFKTPVPIDEILSLPCIPDSARNYRDHFKKYAVNDNVYILAIDFTNKSMNIYPAIFPPGTFSPDRIGEMITELGFARPSDEELKQCSRAPHFYYTFTWEQPTIQRFSFAIPTSAEEFPVHWHPLCQKFIDNVPFQSDHRMFCFSPTYGARGGYMKVEADYRGTLPEIFSYWN